MPKLDVLIRVENTDTKDEYKTTAILADDIIKYKSNKKNPSRKTNKIR